MSTEEGHELQFAPRRYQLAYKDFQANVDNRYTPASWLHDSIVSNWDSVFISKF